MLAIGDFIQGSGRERAIDDDERESANKAPTAVVFSAGNHAKSLVSGKIKVSFTIYRNHICFT